MIFIIYMNKYNTLWKFLQVFFEIFYKYFYKYLLNFSIKIPQEGIFDQICPLYIYIAFKLSTIILTPSQKPIL